MADITAYATAPYSEWYAGIAGDAKERMFGDHNVDEQAGLWIFRTTTSEANARLAENALLAAGFQGGPGGGGDDTHRVYAYKITPTTVE